MELGIDLGTANVLVLVRGRGVVLQEPSVVAMESESRKVVAIGSDARRMLGRTPGSIVAVRPLRDGVIADYEVTEVMLRYFIHQVAGERMLFRPRVMICIPAGITPVERRAVRDAGLQAGAGRVSLVEEPMAAALGAGLDITKPAGSMVVDIGGGTTDVAVLALGGVVVSESLRIGGDRLDEALIRWLKKEENLLIGERTAETLKIEAGSAFPGARQSVSDIRGRDMVSGLPRTVHVDSERIRLALQEPLEAIVEAVKRVLERTPPELAADIYDRGVVLTGGGALLGGLDRLLAEETGVFTQVAEDPLTCVVRGTAKAMEYETGDDHLVVLRKVM